jgi:hypothetical protein
MLVHVAAKTAVAATGISAASAPARTSQRQLNHAVREAALDHHRMAVTPASSLGGDPFMLDSSGGIGFEGTKPARLLRLNFQLQCRSWQLQPGSSLSISA